MAKIKVNSYGFEHHFHDVLLISSVTIIITVETGIDVHTHFPVPFML